MKISMDFSVVKNIGNFCQKEVNNAWEFLLALFEVNLINTLSIFLAVITEMYMEIS